MTNLLTYIKDEDKFVSYSELDINKVNTISPEKKIQHDDCKVECFDENQVLSDCRSKGNVFSYMSRDLVNSENVMSNYGSQNFNSEAYGSPVMSTYNNFTSVMANDQFFISQKRNRNENDNDIENELAVSHRNSMTPELLLFKQKNEKIFKELFTEKGAFKMKWYSVNCIECYNLIKIRKLEKICCEFYLCKQCALKYFSFLNELIVNFNIDKIKEKCVSTCFKFFFCTFCNLVDKEENLEQCQMGLCYNYFHRRCYTLVKFFSSQENNKKIFSCKEKIVEEVLSAIIKDENKKNNDPGLNFTKNKIENKESLMNNYDNGKLIMVLYKTNTISFYKFFVSNFIRLIFSNFITEELQGENFQEMYCGNHTCFVCTNPIDDYNIKSGSYSRPCCTPIHNSCYALESEKNSDHLEFELPQMNSHIPFLHFKVAKEIYVKTKELSLNVSKNKGKFQILSQPNLIDPHVTLISEPPKIITKLSNAEKSQVMKNYKEISENKNTHLMKKNLKSKNLIVEKCECVKKMINNFTQEKESKNCTNKPRKKNPSVSTTFKNSEFKQYVKNQGYCCKENCQNKDLKIECYAKTCESPEEFCINRYPSTKGQYYPSLEVVKTVNRGHGLICTKPIKKGDYILEYSGEICDFATFTENLNSSKIPTRGWYLMSLDKDFYVDAFKYGNKSRFINHSCNPNVYVEKWIGKGSMPRLLIFAKADIKPGTEICYNYNFYYFNKDFEMKCNCGESNCCKIMGSSNNGSKKKPFFEVQKVHNSEAGMAITGNKKISDNPRDNIIENRIPMLAKRTVQTDSLNLENKFSTTIQVNKSLFLKNLDNTPTEFLQEFKIKNSKNSDLNLVKSPMREKGLLSPYLTRSPLSYAVFSPEKSPLTSPQRLSINNIIQNSNSNSLEQINVTFKPREIVTFNDDHESKSTFSTPFLMRNISKVIRTNKLIKNSSSLIQMSKPKTKISEEFLESLKSSKTNSAEKIVKIFTYNKNHNNFSFYLTVLKKENEKEDSYKAIFTEYVKEIIIDPAEELKFIKKKFQILECTGSPGNKENQENFIKKAERFFVFLVRYLLIPKVSN
jgi:hypothetical protein